MADTTVGELGPQVQYLVNPDGEVVPVPAEHAATLLDNGYQIATPPAVHQFDLQQKLGGFWGGVETGAEGVARGATLGLSDMALRAMGVSGERLAAAREINPNVAFGSEMLGMAVPLVLTSGEAAPAEAAAIDTASMASKVARATPVGLAESAGREVVGGLTEAGLPKFVAKPIGNAFEFAPYGMGNVVSEKALGDDHAFSGENIATQVGLSSLIGFGMGTAGQAVGASAKGLYNVAEKAVDALPEESALGNWFRKAGLGTLSPDQLEVMNFKNDNLREILHEWKATVADSKLTGMPIKPEAYAYYTKALTDATAELRDAMFNQVGKVGANVRDALTSTGSDTLKDFRNESEDTIKKAKSVANDFDKAAADAQIPGNAPINAMQEFFNEDVMKAPQAIKDALRDVRSSVLRGGEGKSVVDITHNALDNAQTVLKRLTEAEDPAIRNAAKGLIERAERIKTDPDVFGTSHVNQKALEDAIREATEKLPGKMEMPDLVKRFTAPYDDLTGPVAAARMKLLDWHNADVKLRDILGRIESEEFAGKAIDKKLFKEMVERSSAIHADGAPPIKADTPKDSISHKVFDAAMGVATTMAAHKMGLAGAGMLGPLGLGVAAPFAARTLSRVFKVAIDNPGVVGAALTRAYEAIQDSMHLISAGAKSIAVETQRNRTIEPKVLSKATFATLSKQISTAANSPDIISKYLGAAHPDLYRAAPNVHQSTIITEAKRLQYLYEKLPQQIPHNILGQMMEVTPAQIGKFNRHYQAAINPIGVLADVRRGTVTQEAVDTVKTVFPKLSDRMTAEVTNEIVKSGHLPSYQIRPAVEMFLGHSLSQHSPDFFARSQASYQGSQSQTPSMNVGPVHPSAPAMGKITLAERTAPPAPGRLTEKES
jgi:hypothetical protein